MTDRPGRRRRPAAVNPIATLLFIAAFPTVIMFGVWRYARSQEGGSPPSIDREAQLEPLVPVTPLLSARRTPAVLARETSSTAFENALRPLGGAVLPGSCAGVSVDGMLALSDGLDTPVSPASTLKLIIAAVALEILGPDYSFTTEVRAEVNGGSVGSLYLIGGGDPLLASDWYPSDATFNRYPQQPATSLDALADAVVKAGVTQIGGNVVGDPNRYDLEYYPPTWPVSFRATEGGPIAGLLVNDGRVRNQGVVATDPGLGAAREFARLLQERGVTIVGQPTSGQTPGTTATIASVVSAPLSSIIPEMLQNSDNNTAEMLLKEIGLIGARSGSRSAGLGVVLDRLTAWGVPTAGIALVDGSGLSVDNKVTCAAMLAVLGRFSERDVLYNSLSVAGQSGTLAGYFVGTPLEGVMHGKTGTLTDVKGLAGYMPTKDAGLITFVVLLQGAGVAEDSTFRPIWEKYLADALGSYPAGPSVEEMLPAAAVSSP